MNIRDLINHFLATTGSNSRLIKLKRGLNGLVIWDDLRTLIRPDGMIFDIGANEGQTIDDILAAFPHAEIHSFEPSPRLFEKMSKKASDRVHTWNLGMGAENKPMVLREHEESVMSSLLEIAPAFREQHPVRTETRVEIVSGDAFCETHRIERIDFLKIDTQGYDLFVLRGFRGMLQKRQIKIVYCEINLSGYYLNQGNYLDLLQFMKEVGYDLVGFYENCHRGPILSWCNACFRAPDAK